jgi:4'-phosphopantetheinyl transferase
MSDRDSSPVGTVKIWGVRADPELAKCVASDLPGELLDRLLQLPEPGRCRRIVQQALRRSVLATYAGVEPQELELAFAPGSPIISPVDGLLVSASHFDDMTAIAVSDFGLALGVDIEPFFEADWDAALEMVLAEKELTELDAIPADLRPARYFELWTLKESVMKALGSGLGDRDPGSIEIAITDRGPILEAIDAHAPAEPWGLWSKSVDEHILSVALRGTATVKPIIHRWSVEAADGCC